MKAIVTMLRTISGYNWGIWNPQPWGVWSYLFMTVWFAAPAYALAKPLARRLVVVLNRLGNQLCRHLACAYPVCHRQVVALQGVAAAGTHTRCSPATATDAAQPAQRPKTRRDPRSRPPLKRVFPGKHRPRPPELPNASRAF